MFEVRDHRGVGHLHSRQTLEVFPPDGAEHIARGNRRSAAPPDNQTYQGAGTGLSKGESHDILVGSTRPVGDASDNRARFAGGSPA